MLMVHSAMAAMTGAGLSGGDPDAAAYIAAMTVAPDAARQILINNFFVGIKADGLWGKVDAMWLIAAHNAQAARLNARQPSAFTLVVNGSPTFTTDRGYQGDGAAHLATGFNPAAGVAWSQNSASLAVYVNATASDGPSGAAAIGDGAGQVLISPWTAVGIAGRLNATSSTPGFEPVPTRLGMSVVSRTAATVSNAQRNGVAAGGVSGRASVAPSSSSVDLLRFAGGNYSPDRLAFAWIGGGLTGSEMTALYNRVLDYLAPIGGA